MAEQLLIFGSMKRLARSACFWIGRRTWRGPQMKPPPLRLRLRQRLLKDSRLYRRYNMHPQRVIAGPPWTSFWLWSGPARTTSSTMPSILTQRRQRLVMLATSTAMLLLRPRPSSKVRRLQRHQAQPAHPQLTLLPRLNMVSIRVRWTNGNCHIQRSTSAAHRFRIPNPPANIGFSIQTGRVE